MEAENSILIIDDLEINREMLMDLLGQEYRILNAENGQEALDILKEHYENIEAILLDIVMPVMDGYTVLGHIQNHPQWSKIPVLVMTQIGDEENERKALSMGASDFISRPFVGEIVKHRILNLISLRENAAIVNAVVKDSLTGIYNKDSFYRIVSKELSDNDTKEYDIIALDLEKFKLINDRYGNEEGNRLLCYVAKVISQFARPYRGICARAAGDVFLILLPHSGDKLEHFAQNVMQEMKKYRLDMKIRVKMGIYEIRNREVPVYAMCDRACLAAASIKGKYDTIYAWYDDSIRQRLILEQQITDDMKNALEQQQFQVYLQPKYDLKDDSIAGAEALVRWIHPQRGFMPPGEFIPLFEQNGFITELDYYVWDKTCEILEEQLKTGEKCVPVSVNVSRKDIYREDLPEILLDIVKRHNIDSKYLHLEITETAYTENSEQLIRVVQRLKKYGFIIEMDDFGSGYSSLNMLSELPLDIVKLDMKFLQHETLEEEDRNIISFIINLAKWMNLSVVAEGVETGEQVEMLRKMECNYVQGYFFAKPMPYDGYSKLMEESRVISIDNDEVLKPEEQLLVHENGKDRVMLIVDDVKMNRKALSDIFCTQYDIVEACNGMAALEYLLQSHARIEVILLDLDMPVMDGYEFLEQLKADSRWRGIPVIITAQTGEKGEATVLEMGAADFICKPYHRVVVLRRVENVLKAYK
ncbi:MAG: EAL domain-containing protein [Lachnospiraceae bacterium]|nr:EAL domain-containing protein [Lachnospiraceae bacterium]